MDVAERRYPHKLRDVEHNGRNFGVGRRINGNLDVQKKGVRCGRNLTGAGTVSCKALVQTVMNIRIPYEQ